jgi:hypothetical protein
MTDLLSPVEKKPLKIVSLVAENIKRLVAVRIDPKGHLIQITGKNSHGKSSVLDSIWWVLAGAGNIQKTPIRKGQQTAVIRLDMGEVIATRRFTKLDGEEFSTSVTVTTADGAKLSKPQNFLDSLLGSLAIDPLEFARMPAKKQFDALKGMVAGFDFDKAAGLTLADHGKRQDINRKAKEALAQANAIEIPATTPGERVDEDAIVTELGEVGAFNAQIERRIEGRAKVSDDAMQLRKDADGDKQSAEALRSEAAILDARAATRHASADELEKKLTGAEPLPEPKDAVEVRARLDRAKAINAAVDKAASRKALLADAERLKAESDALTAAMDKREEEKRAAIAAAKLPVDGVEFVGEAIHLNGVPFDQASDAEQLRASLAIAMAANPRLRVIRVRDGSLLDEDGLRIVEEMAGDRDFQVFCERVDSSGRIGFVIENGEVRHTPDEAAQQAAE